MSVNVLNECTNVNAFYVCLYFYVVETRHQNIEINV